MTNLVIFGGLVAALLLIVVISKQWGRKSQEVKGLETNEEARERYEDIASKPDVDSPFSRMRQDD